MDAVTVLTVSVEYIKLVALIVDAVSVDVTFIEKVVIVFPRREMVLNVVTLMVDAVILDAAIPFTEKVLPNMVE